MFKVKSRICQNMDFQIQFHLETVTGEKPNKKKDLYFTFVDWEKTVDQVLGDA